MSDPGVQALFLLCVEIFAVVAAVAIGLALFRKFYGWIRWQNYGPHRAGDQRQKRQDENWRARSN